MNLRSTILQTGALAFCVSVIALSLTGYSVLEIIIISFIAFVIVTLLATLVITIFFPPSKEKEKKEEQLSDNTSILDAAMNKDNQNSMKAENKESIEANNATAKE